VKQISALEFLLNENKENTIINRHLINFRPCSDQRWDNL